MVTYQHVTEAVRNRCFNPLAKIVDSRALLLLIAISGGALIIWIIRQTKTNIDNQTNKLNKYNFRHFLIPQYILNQFCA